MHNTQTFAEVGSNWRFDNGAIRTRHQATHTGKLTDLGRRTTCARVSVDIDRVKGLLTLFLTLFVDNRLGRKTFHHRLGDQVVGARPDIDDLVVLLTLGNQTGGVLIFDFFDFCFSLTNDLGFGFRNYKVVNTNRCA